ncbi:MAG: undecaprenyldiphospho-muramoylpentapeptide beta-N-acetylglucosaminyltransferase [Clostridia bacterium]|nr:undecaprenyldiphospho-muramoylpentapeptide beta-N-acetylglucosaminyltransferase [Clostridia bacterium]
MRLLLCGGGTAGHINPAIAIAEEVKCTDPNAEILFVGREGGLENEAILKAGFKLKTIKIQGLRRSLSLTNLKSVYLALKARGYAARIINDFSPDVILGTGGYVCWPIISSGQKMNIPTALHESNITPGLTTRMLAGKCNKVFLNSDETKKYITKKAKAITTGNPLRCDFNKISRAQARRIYGLKDSELMILSFGGSIGAEKLNKVILDTIKSYSLVEKEIRHIHATGKRYYNEAEARYINSKNGGCKILPYIEDMPTALRAADIVVCRCGAMTLSEIQQVGVAAILIPSPNVSDNHQYKNALHLSERGAATMIEEGKLTTELLIEELKRLNFDKFGRKNRAKTLRALSKPNSAKTIAKELFLLKYGNKKAAF